MPRTRAEPLTEPFGAGGGWQENVILKNVTAGQEFSYTVEGQYIVRLISLAARLVCSATVANRIPTVQVVGVDALPFSCGIVNTAITASQSPRLFFWVGAQVLAPAGSNIQTTPIPSLFVEAGFTIKTATVGLQAGDQWQDVRLVIERWYSDGRRDGAPRRRQRRRALAGT